MTLVDTSVWVSHLREDSVALTSLLLRAEVLCHPFVVGELACGHLTHRAEVLSLLRTLPQARVVDHDEVLGLIETHDLAGVGLGWVDMHLLSSALHGNVGLWTHDRRLARVARRVGLPAAP